MPTNVYFDTGTTSEQRLYEDLIIEQLKIYGQDVYYLPRKLANKDTIFGLSGVGDILLTCTSESSRNFSLGIAIGKGLKIEEIIKNRTTIAEGYYTTKAIYNLVQTLGIDAPILKSVYDILYNTANPIHEAEALLKRPIKESEFY